MKNNILSPKQENNYVWRCVLCNTFNEYSKYTHGCPSCVSSEYFTIHKLMSVCPLYFSKENESITFGINPINSPFYIIRDFKNKTYSNINNIKSEYFIIQTNLENSTHLKLNTIVFCEKNKPIFLIFYEKSHALSFYQLKHILYEIASHLQLGKHWAKLWKFIDVNFDNLVNVGNQGKPDLDEQFIDHSHKGGSSDIGVPFVVDSTNISISHVPRNKYRVIFDKSQYYQNSMVSSVDDNYDVDINSKAISQSIQNINANSKMIDDDTKQNDTSDHDDTIHSAYNIDINNNINIDSKKRTIKPKKVNNMDEILQLIDTNMNQVKYGSYQFEKCAISAYYSFYETELFVMQNFTQTNPINMLACMIKELITNNFERDLLPVSDNCNVENDKIFSIDHDKRSGIQTVNNMVYEYEMRQALVPVSNRYVYGIFDSLAKEFIEKLSKIYKIFNTLKSKMMHSRHKRMGYPLYYHEMLSIILYCNGDCNYDLCESQRSNNAMKKWPYLHCILNETIKKLSQFEVHYENIYTGICGIFYELNNHMRMVCFKSNVSFTTDLNVAKQFRSNDGIIIGTNIQKICSNPCINNCYNGIMACDVSWISKFVSEKEILVRAGSIIKIYPNLVRKQANKQWIVYVEDDTNENSVFKSMFGSPV